MNIRDFAVLVTVAVAIFEAARHFGPQLMTFIQNKVLHKVTGGLVPQVVNQQAPPTVTLATGATITAAVPASSPQVVEADAAGNAIPHPSSLLGQIANQDKLAIRAALEDVNTDATTRQIAANYAARMLNDNVVSAVAFYRTLSASARQLVKDAYLDPKGLYAPDQAGYDANRATQQAAYEQAWKAAEAQL